MKKTILITGATDGIGFETAKLLVVQGHNLLLHGRNAEKLQRVARQLAELSGSGTLECYESDLSCLADVEALAVAIGVNHSSLDVIINNAGVYRIADPLTADGLDARFAVNTIAPYLLTQKLMPLLNNGARVVNLSSAAQATVNLTSLSGKPELGDGLAYAQSKLAITMWTNHLAATMQDKGIVFVSVNPASMLGSKMVKEAYGVAGGDLKIGADILCRAAVFDEFSDASGKYFDNDSGRFAAPHPDALDSEKNRKLVAAIESVLAQKLI